VVGRRKHFDGIGLGQHAPEAFAVGRGEAHLLPPERNRSDEPHAGHTLPEFQHRLGGGQIETHGHAAQKVPETPRVQLPHRPAQGVRSRAAIGAMAGKGDGCAGIGDHASKGKALARTLQAPLLNLNFQQL